MHHHRCRHIPIENTAAIAAVHSFGQSFLGDGAASWACLGGSTRIDTDNLTTGSFSLVGKHCGQNGPRSIVYMFGQHPRCQALNVQILDRNAAKPSDDPVTELVQIIAPPVGDTTLVVRQQHLTPGTGLRAPFAPRQRTLPAAQPFGRTLGPVGTRDRLAGR